MTGGTLRQALAYAASGWPVLPCLPGAKIPATAHGYRDATTDDPSRSPAGSAATRTGTWPSPPAPPAPTSWTSTSTAPPGTDTRRSAGSATPGCSTAPASYVRTPSGGLHAYFTGSAQRNGHLPDAPPGLPLRRRLRPGPALPDRRPALPAPSASPAATAAWTGPPSPGCCNPSASPPSRSPAAPAPGHDIGHLARWVAAQAEGNRNAGLFWAANRALDTDPAADLSPLADAARQAGLPDPEITRTLNSARRTSSPSPAPSRPPSRGQLT